MLKLLERAREEVKKEMDRVGFIDDSDNCDRFLDELSKNLVEKEFIPEEELVEKLLDMVKDEVMPDYNSMVVYEGGNCLACWYKDLTGLVEWAGTWRENSPQEAYQEFIDIYGIDITFKEFMEAYGVEPEDYLEND